MLIALDAMGGDLAPDEVVRGALLAADRLESQVALCGREDRIRALIDGHPGADRMLVRSATEVVEMEDSPRVALRGKPDSRLPAPLRWCSTVRPRRASPPVTAVGSWRCATPG